MVYAAGFGAARVLLRTLLDIIDDLAGKALSPADMTVARQALADAAAWRTWRTEGDREADAVQASLYEALLCRLAAGEEAL